jgi:hypothetical protein
MLREDAADARVRRRKNVKETSRTVSVRKDGEGACRLAAEFSFMMFSGSR